MLRCDHRQSDVVGRRLTAACLGCRAYCHVSCIPAASLLHPCACTAHVGGLHHTCVSSLPATGSRFSSSDLHPPPRLLQVGVDSTLDAFKAALEGADLEGASETSM